MEKKGQTEDRQYHGLQDQVQELKDLARELRAQIDHKDREIADIRQRWKQTAQELGKCLEKDGVVGQVTDPQLTQMARQIQYNIRNFACQHFGDELNIRAYLLDYWRKWRKHLQMPTDLFEACVQSPVKRPMLVDAIIWDFLMHGVFNKFWWGDIRVHASMGDLTDILSTPLQSDMSADWSAAKRKHQMWKANTSALLVDALKLDQDKGQGMSLKLRNKVSEFGAHLSPFTKSEYEVLQAQLLDIIKEALDLDQLLSKQVADINWTVHIGRPGTFNEAVMEPQLGEKRPVDGQKVQLVVAPGLIKRGRSTGEDYETTSILLKMRVSCELITTRRS